MHKVDIPQWVLDRVMEARGKLHTFDDLNPRTTALLVVDMQNAFLMDNVAHSLSTAARGIVPNINRIAATLRSTGGLVVWIKNVDTLESHTSWSVYRKLLTPARRAKRTEAMREGAVGHELWSELDVRGSDLILKKERFSAFIQGSSDLEQQLRSRGIDTVVVTGTDTGVCCESTARDAMMRNFKTIMVSDGNASKTDAEHNAALTAFYRNFGDVMSTDELIGYIHKNSAAEAASAPDKALSRV
ncbi:MAG TPA: isochorismatase family cysteine hydrolase [Alphaproteobacteria bacterium]|jgi:ureidoacrylate peracid hydrolase|nr:isochorismatase family cysteine hydrolase [Alphaproteobacteria bacterium]